MANDIQAGSVAINIIGNANQFNQALGNVQLFIYFCKTTKETSQIPTSAASNNKNSISP
jgi:hypothetical protein